MPDHLREVKMIKLQMGEFEDTRKNLKKKIVQDWAHFAEIPLQQNGTH